MIYILIMSMWSSGNYATIATAEFGNEAACVYAGAKQRETLQNDLKVPRAIYTFVCVPKDDE